jgi:hypothetical protein
MGERTDGKTIEGRVTNPLVVVLLIVGGVVAVHARPRLKT